MEHEFDCLIQSLQDKKQEFLQTVDDEQNEKYNKLQEQKDLLEKTQNEVEELIKDAESVSTKRSQSAQEINEIKQRATMSPAFRIALAPQVADLSCYLAVDFARQNQMVQHLKFLSPPGIPTFIEEQCRLYDNKLYCQWYLESADRNGESCDDEFGGEEDFTLQFRQVDSISCKQDVKWKTVSHLTDNRCLIEDLIFDHSYLQVRCQASNKAVRGEYSAIMCLETPAFSFRLDENAAHSSMTLVAGKQNRSVEWESAPIQTSKSNESRPSTATNDNKTSQTPLKKNRSRFMGESFTILGDTALPTDEQIYFEVACHVDTKQFAVGITHDSINKFDQLGRTSSSWAVYVNRWMQNSVQAKHNNKMKTLDKSEYFPQRIALYFNPLAGILQFYDAKTRQLLHCFNKIKRSQKLLVGLHVWKGSLQVFCGLRVPTWVQDDFNISNSTFDLSSTQ